MEGPLTVVGVSSERSLGDALNAGVDAASGEVVTKMDDDDWYGSDHLWDLMLALDYSGAELVAKGAEFVYMEELDITIRRFTGRSEGSERDDSRLGDPDDLETQPRGCRRCGARSPAPSIGD